LPSVLLALDDTGLSVLLVETLERAGHQVAWKAAQAAMPDPRAEPPDVLVIDGDTPGLNLGAMIPAWRRLEAPPALLLLGGTPASTQAAARFKVPLLSKPVDTAALPASIAQAAEMRFLGHLSIPSALQILNIPTTHDREQDIVEILGASRRMTDPTLVRKALRARADDYVVPTPLIPRLRDLRALTIPEVGMVTRFDGSFTVRTTVDAGVLDPVSAARLVWALGCVGAIGLFPEPPDLLSQRAQAVLWTRRHLKARRARVDKATAYEVLEVAADAHQVEIEQACQMLAVWYSPVRMEALDLGNLAPLVEPLWQQVLKARATLLEPAKRATYDSWLAAQGRDPRAQSLIRKISAKEAEESFLSGQKALAAGDVFRAVSDLASAARRLSDEPDYEAYVAWARFLSEEKRGDGDRATAVKRDRRAAEEALLGRRPRPRALLALGLLCEAAGDVTAAREHLRDALECDPRLAPAQKALSRLGSTPDSR